MELALVIQPPGGPACDLVVDVDEHAPADEMIPTIAAHVGLGDQHCALFHTRAQRWLDATSVASSGIRSGDVFLLARREATRWIVAGDLSGAIATRDAAPVVEVAIVGGADAGRRVPLPLGRHRVGTDEAAAVRLSDTQVAPLHAVIDVDSGRVMISPQDSMRLSVEGTRITAPTEITPDDMVFIGSSRIVVRPLVAPREIVTRGGRVPFNRPPRESVPPAPREIAVPPVPKKQDRQAFQWLAVILPMVFGVGLIIMTRNPMYAGFMLLSPVMIVAQSISSRRSGKKQGRGERAEFLTALDRIAGEVRDARAEERRRRRASAPDAAEVVARAVEHRVVLWERRPTDADFLSMRLGFSDLVPLLHVAIPPGGRDDLTALAVRKTRADRRLRSVPLAPALPEHGSIGVVGDPDRVDRLGRWMLLQAAALHSPRDLTVAVAVPASRAAVWEWARWLPHGVDPSAPDGNAFAVGPDATRGLLMRVTDLISARAAERRSMHAQNPLTGVNRLLLILDESVVESRATVDRILTEGPAAGVHVVWLGRTREDLPGACRAVATVAATGTGHFMQPGTDEPIIEFLPDDVVGRLMANAGRALAPVTDTSSVLSSGGIPRVVPILDMLDLHDTGPSAIVANWNVRRTSLDAPIGVSADGPLSVDLRRDGPHALVAGTTGSGKSELLQALVVALAARHAPTRLNFLFVDYKGGAAFSECVELPHAVGMVTDLDGRLAQRVLTSLNAEIRRREHDLKVAGHKDIATWESAGVDGAPPNLVIVVDEFAVLAREVPDFVDGIVDIAQRGRSLGMHLVLATQRPSGVVSENIRANTNLRVALRVSDSTDSTDVIGDDSASRIPRTLPGRAYARLGHSELSPFQAAYSGGRSTGRATRTGAVVHTLGERPAADTTDESGPTDLAVLVQMIQAANAQLALPKARRPWLEPLPRVVALEKLPPAKVDPRDPGRTAVIGVIDEPVQQRQRVLQWDFETDGNVLIYGGTGSGKTTALRAYATAFARTASPENLWIVGIDCASGALQSLTAYPHTVSVAPARDAEQVAFALDLLIAQLEQRKVLLSSAGVSSLSEYRRLIADGGGEDLGPPRIIVLLDSMPGFQAAFERVEYGAWTDRLNRLVADGRPAGIHFVITSDRRGGVPHQMASTVGRKLVMKLADKDEYSSLGVKAMVAKDLDLPIGRALDDGMEIHFGLVGPNPAGDAQTAAIAQVGVELKATFGARTPRVGVELPEAVSFDGMPVGPGPAVPMFAIARTIDGLRPVGVNLEHGHLLVTGPRRSGRSTALSSVGYALRAIDVDAKVHLLAPRPSAVAHAPWWSSVASGPEQCTQALGAMVRQAGSGIEVTKPIFVVVDDADEFLDGEAAMYLEQLLRSPVRASLRMVVACDASTANRSFSGWLAEVRRPKQALLLRPDPAADGDLAGIRLRELPGQAFPPGRGYLVADRTPMISQVALPPDLPAIG